jgi:hypothetical protein
MSCTTERKTGLEGPIVHEKTHKKPTRQRKALLNNGMRRSNKHPAQVTFSKKGGCHGALRHRREPRLPPSSRLKVISESTALLIVGTTEFDCGSYENDRWQARPVGSATTTEWDPYPASAWRSKRQAGLRPRQEPGAAEISIPPVEIPSRVRAKSLSANPSQTRVPTARTARTRPATARAISMPELFRNSALNAEAVQIVL